MDNDCSCNKEIDELKKQFQTSFNITLAIFGLIGIFLAPIGIVISMFLMQISDLESTTAEQGAKIKISDERLAVLTNTVSSMENEVAMLYTVLESKVSLDTPLRLWNKKRGYLSSTQHPVPSGLPSTELNPTFAGENPVTSEMLWFIQPRSEL
jgi:hypothetical protein